MLTYNHIFSLKSKISFYNFEFLVVAQYGNGNWKWNVSQEKNLGSVKCIVKSLHEKMDDIL